MFRSDRNLSAILESYLLATDLCADTEDWYRRVVRVFSAWHGTDPAEANMTAETISRFLRDKARDGCSTHYCKSLRNGLLAILGTAIDPRLVRSVRVEKLTPHAWTAVDVTRLIHAVSSLPEPKRPYYRQAILLAYHTGVSKNDLHRLKRQDFDETGTLVFDRNKTGAAIVAWVPPELLAEFAGPGPMVPRRWSDEQFRKDFKRIVAAAGLAGTFKTLRKTSGTLAEILTGRGHEHLANSRAIFEKHYLDRKRVHREPVRLPRIEPHKS